eukprot:8109958-Pyramimonas_sp.AAC.1
MPALLHLLRWRAGHLGPRRFARAPNSRSWSRRSCPVLQVARVLGARCAAVATRARYWRHSRRMA